MVKINIKKILISGAVFGMIVSPVAAGVLKDNVSSISKACQNSTACREAVAKEQEANKNAAAAANTADAFQNKVNELNIDIAGKEAEIAETEANVRELKKQITEVPMKLFIVR